MLSFLQGYFTIGVWCSYHSENKLYSENLTLFKKGDQVRCDCDVTYPGEDTAQQRPMNDVDAICTLSITRCPNSITLISS